ncbi:hypothetical protein [Pseudomonas donghuensis]|uniref:hypothetical protein n=1 Tax=Pseudomonas donghuensis TaxID=1163398 RepID=UPI00215FAEC7|nr:hypothetical protein [Pseudomonas donghuensis]UVL26196.1 hypothetical protein LOY30_09505 [Pseudomonas donghuensis]
MERIAPEGLFNDTKSGGKPDSFARPNSAPGQEVLASAQAVYLRTQETGLYVNINGSGWAVLESNPSTKYVLVTYYQNNYIVIADGSYKNYYLSYSNHYYVGGYKKWTDASYWAVDPVNCSPYPGLYPYYTGGANYLCCNGVTDAIDKLVTVVSY